MELITTYPAAVNSKATVTMGVLDQATTIVEVLDATVLPEAPNLLVLGTDQTAETVLMTARENNTLTIQRAVQGIAKSWPAGTQIARNFTAKDWDDMRSNVEAIATKILGLTASDVGALPNNQPVPIDKGGTGATNRTDALGSLAAVGSMINTANYSYLGEITTNGVYQVSTIHQDNPPNSSNYGILLVFQINGYAQQFYQSTNDTDSRRFYVRTSGDGGSTWGNWINLADASKFLPLSDGAGFHNSVYRGKSLGPAVTDAQWAAISNGTFRDLYIGDYWTIGGINYRIAAFDYYLRAGDTDMTTHHVTLVPDANMYTHVMNDTNITTGGYVGSKMYTEGLEQAKTTINTAFGSAHVLTHRQYLCNAVTNGKPSGGSWYDSTVELMTEQNCYGGKVFGAGNDGSTVPSLYTVDKSQFPLFAFRPDMISNRNWFWLRDVVSAALFAVVLSGGVANCNPASYASGVRPAFSIIG